MADAVLKINPETEECTFIGGPFLGARVAWNNITYHLYSIFVEFFEKVRINGMEVSDQASPFTVFPKTLVRS